MVALTLTATLSTASAKSHLGVPLPPGAKQVSENRFKSTKGFWETIKWMENQFRKRGLRVRFVKTMDLPDVVSSHAGSPKPSTSWVGINVSRYGGSTKIFVIKR